MIDAGRESGVLDFTEMAAGNVVDKAADGEGLGNPGMGAELLQLVADIFFDVLERVKEGGGDSLGPGAVLDSGAQILFGGVHQAAIGVVDDHEFVGAGVDFVGGENFVDDTHGKKSLAKWKRVAVSSG